MDPHRLLYDPRRSSNYSLMLSSLLQRLVGLHLVCFDRSFNAGPRSDTLPARVLFRLDGVGQPNALLSSFLDGADVFWRQSSASHW